MDVFTGNEILFLITGALIVVFAWVLAWLRKKYEIKWYAWVVAILGCFQVLFAMQWAVSSILEGEAQAANMGLLIFGLPGLLLMGVASKIVMKGVK
ncbi:MAG: dehalogenase [Deltaproteobacteria bacterium]|nr:dehalogenase [Deltaproteobacteria bacterium]